MGNFGFLPASAQGPSSYCHDTILFSKLDTSQNVWWTLMIRCCVAEPLVRTRLGAFPPIISAPSYLSRFTNFSCRLYSKCFQGAEGSFTIGKQASYPGARENKWRKWNRRRGKRKKEKKKFTFLILLLWLLNAFTPKLKKVAHNLQVSRTRFAACAVPRIFFS